MVDAGASATVFAPATIGNVGPGFDVLGLCVEGLGDRVTITLLADGEASRIDSVTGADAADIPRDASLNAVSIAAHAMLTAHGLGARGVSVRIERTLPLSGGMGGSAAASVGGALAAAIAAKMPITREGLFEAALAGESAVAGRHLDNIAPCVLGGLTLVRPTEPLDVIELNAPAWWVALVTPDVRISTKDARAVLPLESARSEWVMQMANTAALVSAFAREDEDLARRALVDVYAEPRRAKLIPGFYDVQRAAREAGALGASISGAGPTIFALCTREDIALACVDKMKAALPMGLGVRLAAAKRIARRGAYQILPSGDDP